MKIVSKTLGGILLLQLIFTYSFAQMSGSYSIGPGKNFSTIQAAVTQLNTSGVGNPVVFNIDPGTYPEQLTFDSIPGTSSFNTVTFQSSTGKATDVLVYFVSSNASDNWVLRLDSTDNITFKNLKLQNGSINTSYSLVTSLNKECRNVSFDNVIFQGHDYTSSQSSKALFVCVGGDDNISGLSIKNSSFFNGGHAVFIDGGSASKIVSNFNFNNNIINTYRGIYLKYCADFKISQSDILFQNEFGVKMEYCGNNVTISGNKIRTTSGYYEGIYAIYTNATAGNEAIISNNMISLGAGKTSGNGSNGIYINSSSYFKILNNSIELDININSGNAVNVNYGGNIDLINNNLSNKNGGVVLYVNGTSVFNTLDFNNYYSPGNSPFYWMGTNAKTLKEFRVLSTQDLNSVSFLPVFQSTTDLHTFSPYLSGKGTPLSEVTDDIDGNARKSPPCIGADEYIPYSGSPFNGSYTIGTGGNFPSLALAVDTLEKMGISGPVAFNITGDYLEQVTIRDIPGASPANTITFKSKSGDSTDVTIAYNSSSDADNYVIRLYGANYITFKNITFMPSTGTYSRVFDLFGYSHNNTIKNNLFVSTATPSSDARKAAIFSENSRADSIDIENNLFASGGMGIVMAGPSNSDNASTLKIVKNTFNTLYTGITLTDYRNVVVSENHLKEFTYNGISLSTCNEPVMISKNKLISSKSQGNGIVLSSCSGAFLKSLMIQNNFISSTYSSSSPIGIYLSYSSYCNVYHNSVNIKSDYNSYAFQNIQGNNHDLKNNIFANFGDGYAYYNNLNTAIAFSDFNNLFSIGRYVGKWENANAETLTDFKLLPTPKDKDLNSVSVNPTFVSDMDLHTNSSFLDNEGVNLSEVNDDIDGETRPVSTQSKDGIGADAYASTLTPMKGLYTIGQGGAEDYPSFNSALSDLTARGINGVVIFDVSKGIYNERFSITEIAGTNALDTIVFRSKSGNPSDVTLEYETLQNENYIVELNGADYISFANMTFSVLGKSNYGRIITLKGRAVNNNIVGSVFYGMDGNGTNYTNNTIIYVNDNYPLIHNLRIVNNTINNGYAGIYLSPNTNTPSNGVQIVNNIIKSYYFGIQTHYTDGIIISKNKVLNALNIAVYLNQCNKDIKVTKNVINTPATTYGLHFNQCTAVFTKEGIIANNMISCGNKSATSSGAYGLKFDNSSFQKVYYNSVLTTTSATSNTSAFHLYSCDNIKVYNNSFVHGGNGYAYATNNTTGVSGSDYNNIYAAGTKFAQWSNIDYADLTKFNQVSLTDGKSISVDPNYISDANLHAGSSLLKGKGKSGLGVLDDIDGDLRDLIAPNIGADELVCSTPVFTIFSSVACLNQSTMFVDSSLNVSDGSVYFWDFDGDGTFDDTTGFETDTVYYTYSSVGTQTGQLKIVQPAGCVDFEILAPLVLAIPDATILPVNPICENSAPITLKATTKQGVWNGPGISNSQTGEFDPSLTGYGLFKVSYSLQETNGCSSVGNQFVNVAIVPEVMAMSPGAIACDTNAVELKAKIINSIPKSCGLSLSGCNGNLDSVFVGTSKNTTLYYYYPNVFHNYYGVGTRSQFLYRADDLKILGFEGGKLSEIGFEIADTNQVATYDNFEIKLTCTNETELKNNWITNTYTVFNAKKVRLTNGLNIFSFDNVFEWDGVSNIVVDICFKNKDRSKASSINYYSSTSYPATLYSSYNYDIDVCTDTIPPSSSAYQLPNTYFGFCAGYPEESLTYQWSPSNSLSSSTIQNPVAVLATPTLYHVTVTDSTGLCVGMDSIFVTIPESLTLMPNPKNVSCNGCNDGMASVIISGGQPPYVYNWINDSSTDSVLNSRPQGSYDVEVTDNMGCKSSTTVEISYLNIDFKADIQGGCAPLNVNFDNLSMGAQGYRWYINSTNGKDTIIESFSLFHTFKQGGNYNVTLVAYEDDSLTIELGKYSQDIYVDGLGTWASSDSACKGDNITFNIINGNNSSNNDDFSWDLGDGTTKKGWDVSHNYATDGIYTVIVTGSSANCGSQTVEKTIVVGSDITPNVTFSTGLNNNKSCPNDNVRFYAQGGSGLYLWSFDDGSPSVTTSENRVDHSFASQKDYNVQLTVTNGCGKSGSYSEKVSIVTGLGFQNNQNFDVDVRPNPVCPGDVVSFDLRYPDYYKSYVWDFGDGADTNMRRTFHSFSNTKTYNTSIKITNGCDKDTTIFVPVLVENGIPINKGDYQYVITPGTACVGDSILFLAQNGGKTYTWDFGDGKSASPSILEGDFNATLYAYSQKGIYEPTLSITNSCGSKFTDTLSVTVGSGITPGNSPIGEPFAVTSGDNNSTINVCEPINFVAFVGGKTYEWDFGDGQKITTSSILVTHYFTVANNYTVKLKVTNGCDSSATFTQSYNVSGVCMGPVVSFKDKKDPSCDKALNGSVTVSPSGGTPPYTFLWSNGKATASINGLVAGTYTVTVTDKNNISTASSIVFTNTMSISLVSTPGSCLTSTGGTASVTVQGGVSPYSFLWTDGSKTSSVTNLSNGVHTVAVSDASGCNVSKSTTITSVGGPIVAFKTISPASSCGLSDGYAETTVTGGTSPYSFIWSNGKTAANLVGVVGGTYNLTVTDKTGCAATAQAVIGQPTPPTVQSSIINESGCGLKDGLIQLTTSGGTLPYSYKWSGGSTGDKLISISGGTYSVTVSDAVNCKVVKEFMVTTPGATNGIVVGKDLTCNGSSNGEASVSISGGTAPYSYDWSNGKKVASLTGLSAGSYAVTVTDKNQCKFNGSVVVNQPSAIQITGTVSNVTTCGGSDGKIEIRDVTGGSQPYTYLWSNSETGTSISNLSPGSYALEVTDNSGCKKKFIRTVSAPSAANLSFQTTGSKCNNVCDGTAKINVTGGASPFSFEWSNGLKSDMISGLCAGTYSVTVTESNGCQKTDSVSIDQPDSLKISVVSTKRADCGKANGEAMVTAEGGTSPYKYQWTNGDRAEKADTLFSGIYTVTVIDKNNCINFTSAKVGDNGGPEITVNSITHVTCFGKSNGAISLSVSGGTGSYEYKWTTGSKTEDVSNLPAGSYEVTVTDDGKCSAYESIVVTRPERLKIAVSSTDANCGSSNGMAVVSAKGGTPLYKYLWTGGIKTDTLKDVSAGTYQVTVIDSLGCVTKGTAAISEIGGAILGVDSLQGANCESSGAAFISVVGGVGPFTYEWADTSNVIISNAEDLTDVAPGTYDVLVTASDGCSANETVLIEAKKPNGNPICLVSVDTDFGGNLIAWEKEQGLGIKEYRIYRETSTYNQYQLVGTVPFTDLSQFIDLNSDPTIRSYKYKMSIVNDCDVESDLSDIHRTIHLTINPTNDDKINLIWSDYEGFDVFTYYIHRYSNAEKWKLIDSLAFGNNSYLDKSVVKVTNDLSYFIEVKHPDGCESTKRVTNYNSTRSNISKKPDLSTQSVTALVSSTQDSGNCDGTATASVAGGTAPYTYLWDDPKAQTDSTATGLCEGAYVVTVTDNNGASTTVSVFVALKVGIVEVGFNGSFSIYPNPNNGKFTIEAESKTDLIKSVRLSNSVGQTVFLAQEIDKMYYKATIDVDAKATGIYFLQVSTENGITQQKVVVR